MTAARVSSAFSATVLMKHGPVSQTASSERGTRPTPRPAAAHEQVVRSSSVRQKGVGRPGQARASADEVRRSQTMGEPASSPASTESSPPVSSSGGMTATSGSAGA